MSKKRPSKYRRCKKCKELVRDPDNCENCKNHNPLSITRASAFTGKRGKPNLDRQEGTYDE